MVEYFNVLYKLSLLVELVFYTLGRVQLFIFIRIAEIHFLITFRP